MWNEMNDTRQNLTLEAIGRLAGVSRSTVSRVLNDHPHVRPDVRALVEAVIEQTGYLPHQAARALASNRTGLIGLVMPADIDELFGDPYYSALVHGIQDGCADVGSAFSIFPIYGQHDQTTVLSTLVAQGFVDGVIVTAGPRSDHLITTLRDRGKDMVVVGHPADDRGLKRVDVDNRSGSASAVAHLCDLDRMRIGLIGPTAEYVFGVERLNGYRDALTAAGRAFDDRLVQLDEPTSQGGYRAAVALLSERPDAIHVATDTMAMGVMQAIHEHGLRIPDDIALVGFDGLPNAPRTDPTLATVVQPVTEVGRTAVHLLHGDVEGSRVVILPTSLRLGASCGALGTSARSS
jgi:LacI family transcriptional regulator